MKNLSIIVALLLSPIIFMLYLPHGAAAGNYHHNNPTSTPTRTPTPTKTPTPTPTPTVCKPTVTPTIEATPTASPSATLTPTASPEAKLEPNQDRHDEPLTNDTTHKSNPNCDTPKPGKVEVVTYHNDKPNDGIVRLEWSLPLRAKTVNIYFGTDMWNYQHSVIEYPNTGHINIGFLDPSKSYWYTIEGKDGCATGERSYPIDPEHS